MMAGIPPFEAAAVRVPAHRPIRAPAAPVSLLPVRKTGSDRPRRDAWTSAGSALAQNESHDGRNGVAALPNRHRCESVRRRRDRLATSDPRARRLLRHRSAPPRPTPWLGPRSASLFGPARTTPRGHPAAPRPGRSCDRGPCTTRNEGRYPRGSRGSLGDAVGCSDAYRPDEEACRILNGVERTAKVRRPSTR